MVDDASRGVWAYLMSEKSEVSQLLMDFYAMDDTQFSAKVKIVKSHNGHEFSSEPMKTFY